MALTRHTLLSYDMTYITVALTRHILLSYKLSDIRLILKAVSTQLYNINDDEDK